MHRNQFLLTLNCRIRLQWPETPIGDYTLFRHPELRFHYREDENQGIYLLGLIYAWWQPDLTNQGVVDYLFKAKSVDELIQQESPCMGEYTIIYQNSEGVFIFNDASGLSEIYYDEDFTTFGTQPKLISGCVAPRSHSDKDAQDFYNSKQFTDNRIFVGNTTHLENIFHLMPNHIINISDRKINRFYPKQKINRLPLKQAAKMAAERLKGNLKAVSIRNKMAIPVTGGLDSRVLFLASLGLDCDYMVIKTKNMNDSHHDISIPRRLTALFNKPFRVIPFETDVDPELWAEYINSVDFPRQPTLGKGMKITDGIFYINGNISEIARNYFGYHRHLNGADLNYLNLFGDRYPIHPFPTRVYNNWLKENRKYFKLFGHHYLDMFYWEEKMGNWCAKAFTEEKALGFMNISPYNSRALLDLMLCVNRKFRDLHFNNLYDSIIKELTDKWEKVFEIPVNPVAGQNKIRKMKKMGVYKFYSHYKLKRRTLVI
jgi:hypothetical protein